VKALISRPAETKYVATPPTYTTTLGVNNLSGFTGFSSAITSTAEIMCCLPALRGGVANHQRIGNKVHPTSLTVTLDLTATFPDASRSVDKTVHIFLMTCKAVKSLDNFSAIPITTFLDNGQGAITDFDGTVMKSFYPVDRSQFTLLKHKKIRLCKGFGLIVDSTVNTSVAVTDSVVTPSQSYKRIKMRVPVPKTLLYDTSSSNYPQNFAPFFVIGYTNNVGTDTAPNGIDVMVQGNSELYYKDS